MWWGIQTVSSVGYGDLVPRTIVGRMFASVFMLFGAITMSLPVLTLVSQFTTLYPKNVQCAAYGKQYKSREQPQDRIDAIKRTRTKLQHKSVLIF